jgi:hypothetical protein
MFQSAGPNQAKLYIWCGFYVYSISRASVQPPSNLFVHDHMHINKVAHLSVFTAKYSCFGRHFHNIVNHHPLIWRGVSQRSPFVSLFLRNIAVSHIQGIKCHPGISICFMDLKGPRTFGRVFHPLLNTFVWPLFDRPTYQSFLTIVILLRCPTTKWSQTVFPKLGSRELDQLPCWLAHQS